MNQPERERWAKEIIEFARPIIPKNWNIYPAWEEKLIFKPGKLNIALDIWGKPCDWYEDGEYLLGAVHGPIQFLPIKMFTKIIPEARKASRKYPGRKIAMITISVYPGIDFEATIIEELAHLAAVMKEARKDVNGARRKWGIFGGAIEKKMHGRKFQKAHRRLITRVEKKYGKEKGQSMRNELNYYRLFA